MTVFTDPVTLAAIMDWLQKLDPGQLVLLIPIVAIIAWGAISITKLWIRHRERLAMIQKGLHPDLPPEGIKSAKPTDD